MSVDFAQTILVFWLMIAGFGYAIGQLCLLIEEYFGWDESGSDDSN